MAVTLRPLEVKDEYEALAAHQLLGKEGFEFLHGFDRAGSWSNFVRMTHAHNEGRNLPEGWVPYSFLFAYNEADEFVGRVSIRHELNDSLSKKGGHIGFGVLPKHRQRGYATAMLRQGLILAKSYGVEKALVTCAESFVWSRQTIIKCGGVPGDSSIDEESGEVSLRFWIDTTNC